MLSKSTAPVLSNIICSSPSKQLPQKSISPPFTFSANCIFLKASDKIYSFTNWPFVMSHRVQTAYNTVFWSFSGELFCFVLLQNTRLLHLDSRLNNNNIIIIRDLARHPALCRLVICVMSYMFYFFQTVQWHQHEEQNEGGGLPGDVETSRNNQFQGVELHGRSLGHQRNSRRRILHKVI